MREHLEDSIVDTLISLRQNDVTVMNAAKELMDKFHEWEKKRLQSRRRARKTYRLELRKYMTL
jgi:hypothetical protein